MEAESLKRITMINSIIAQIVKLLQKRNEINKHKSNLYIKSPLKQQPFRNFHFLPVKSLLSQPLYVFSPILKTSRKYIFTQRNQIKRIQ